MSERPPSDPSHEQPVAVRIERVPKGGSMNVRALSPHYAGLFTHWNPRKKKGEYCAGDDCPLPMHKTPRTWHGYFAAQLYDAGRQRWSPCVFELTEHAELDLRGRYRRGQVWRFDRPATKGDKAAPVTATLLGSYPDTVVPVAFDLRNVLRYVFHVSDLNMGHANPLPPRVLVVEQPFSKAGFEVHQVEPAELPCASDRARVGTPESVSGRESASDHATRGVPSKNGSVGTH